MRQRVAVLHVGPDAFYIYVSPHAIGDPKDWLDHALVRKPSKDGMGESEVTDFEKVYAVEWLRGYYAGTQHTEDILYNKHTYYHVRIRLLGGKNCEVKLDMTLDELENRVLKSYRNLKPIVLNGRTMLPEKLERIEVIASMKPSSSAEALTHSNARAGVHDWTFGWPTAKDVTDEFIVTPSVASAPQEIDAIKLLCSKFHSIARQLRQRHAQKPTLDVKDEYDVQDLMHALLEIFFSDIRPEETTPSFAGKSARMDFLLLDELVVLETKMTRPNLDGKKIGEELTLDIAKYQAHPKCKRLICFVYDPDGYIANPRGLENDLSGKRDELEVEVYVRPMHL
jgi:hypothetical protein